MTAPTFTTSQLATDPEAVWHAAEAHGSVLVVDGHGVPRMRVGRPLREDAATQTSGSDSGVTDAPSPDRKAGVDQRMPPADYVRHAPPRGPEEGGITSTSDEAPEGKPVPALGGSACAPSTAASSGDWDTLQCGSGSQVAPAAKAPMAPQHDRDCGTFYDVDIDAIYGDCHRCVAFAKRLAAAERELEEYRRGGIFLPGWQCPCGKFNGSARELLRECGACGADKPEVSK